SVPWRRQAIGWAGGYVIFAGLCVVAARRAASGPSSRGETSDDAPPLVPAPSWTERSLWTGLAAGPSLLLVAVASHLTQHIVPAPLLWILPLAAYLLTLVLCFEWPHLYWRPAWIAILSGALVGLGYLMRLGLTEKATPRVASFVIALFACCMACHG